MFMSNNQLIYLAIKYQQELGAIPEKMNRSDIPVRLPGDESELLSHLSWMCGQIPVLVENGKTTEANAIINFVQGSMWSLGMQTIDMVKTDSAPLQ